MHRARKARPPWFDSLPSLGPDLDVTSPLARRDHRKSKFGIRYPDSIYRLTKSEFLIFDDPAEQEDWQRSKSGPREGKLPNQGGRALRARCNNFVLF